MALITYGDALRHLRLTDDSEAPDLELKIAQATALVLKFAKREEHYWDEDTDPDQDGDFAIIQAAIFKVLTNLYGDRGDNERPTGGPLSDDVKMMLHELRPPSMA